MDYNPELKVKYLHGRPGAHYTHANFARQVNADFEFIDFKYRWQDQRKNIFYIIYSWFFCARNYTNRKLYDIFLVDNLHFPPVIMKYLFLKRRKQKIVVYLGSHTLYFMYAKKFSRINLLAHKIALRSYDAIICEGEMANNFATNVLGRKRPPIYTVFNGIPDPQNLSAKPKHIVPGKKILFVGSYENEFRFQYKGIDIMLKAFEIAFQSDPELRFTLVGKSEKRLLDEILNAMGEKTRQAITIMDFTANLEEVIFDHHIYLHCSRGDAFPTTVLIAMSAGMPVIVNELNGTYEAVAKVNSQLIAKQDPGSVAATVKWFLELSLPEKEKIMADSKRVAAEYSEAKSVERFKTVFNQLEQDLHIQRK